MDDQLYSVRVEQGVVDDREPGAAEEDLLEALHALEHPDAVVGGGGPNRLAARLGVYAHDPSEAAAAVIELLRTALDKAGLRVAGSLEAEVVPQDELDLDNATPGPELMGAAEAAGLLGVSRQRVYQLQTLPGFPRPAARLARGDVWRRRDLAVWQQGRNRAPGRPRSGPSET